MRYISKLYLTQLFDKNLSDSDFYSLYYIATNKKTSTYQLTKFLSTTQFKMNYKNVHKKVKKLQSIQLIEESKEKSIQSHAAIFYQLSDIGVFHIFDYLYERRFLFKIEQIIEIFNGLLNYYGENDFFYVFIYPFFNKRTLANLKSETILWDLLNYCKKCCSKVNLQLLSWNAFFNTTVILRWSYLINFAIDISSRDKVQTWLMDLRRRFQWEGYKDIKNCLDWIDNDISVNSIDENTIIINRHENTLFLKLDKYQKKMDLLFNKKNILQFDVEAKDDDYIVNKYDIFEKQNALLKLNLSELLNSRKSYLEVNMVLPFINSGKLKDIDIENWKKLEQDAINLINDEKFYNVIKKTINDFERSSINILKYKN